MKLTRFNNYKLPAIRIVNWFCDYLLNEIQVVGTAGEDYFRFSTLGSPEDTVKAANRFVKLLGKK